MGQGGFAVRYIDATGLPDGDHVTEMSVLDLISVVPFVTERIPLVLVIRDGQAIGRHRKDGSVFIFPPDPIEEYLRQQRIEEWLDR